MFCSQIIKYITSLQKMTRDKQVLLFSKNNSKQKHKI